VTSSADSTLKRFEDELEAAGRVQVDLTLYVSGASDLAARAVTNARRFCELHLEGRYRLSVVDIHEDPDAVLHGGVLATPTLVRNKPLPVRKVVGDLSEMAKVLHALQISPTHAPPASA
jgi:circadian clock protein KaiB